MGYVDICPYNNGMEIGKIKCKYCHRKFNMEGSCCLDLCGEHDRCRGCKNGIYSQEYKEWRARRHGK